ncbi:hypothetical protein T4B_13922 [Trichinella pseudospiralis]|uniref:Uncharacterized protein n=1 Tax=Trichinella pseudospiralis TaxID=6337 RepID=A0A0V1IX06_TRIPS|nr:hypothetical protein T4A_2399 [Trichinella pseudospiralis]KRZ26789.1 hypothetical protein T4B_13922 [Trichinella pseudospiralis]KRZ41144.1 hypothetical protein T4C_8678 [Trichinella pseudospiralis]
MASSTFVGRQYSLNFDFAVQDDVFLCLFICETGTTIFIQLLIDSLPSGCRWTLTSVGPLKRSSRLAGWLAGWLGHGC